MSLTVLDAFTSSSAFKRPELGASSEGARVSRTMTRALKSEGCNSETNCPDPRVGLGAVDLLRKPRPSRGWGWGWDQGLSDVEIHL